MRNTINLKILITGLQAFLLVFVGCKSSDDEWVELFNGEDLSGWHTYGKGSSHDGWYVENSELLFDFSSKADVGSSNLITDEVYTNFELSLEWKIAEKGNSGVFWGVLEDTQYDHPYQSGPEVQILDDNWTEYVEGRGDKNRAGSLYGLMAPKVIVSKGAGEWNRYLLHIDHDENSGYLIFNDQEVLRFPLHGPDWDAMVAGSSFADWPGFGTYQSGHIGLQDHGGKVAFRNIMIKVLPSKDKN